MSRLAHGALATLACGGLFVASLTTACSRDEAPGAREEVKTSDTEEPALVLPEDFARVWALWRGDLDGIVERRVLRLLVTYSATNYFVDRGEQGGVVYEVGRLLEKELNRRFRKGGLHLDVIFIPVTRDRLLPALVEGHGDVAAASLTITEERQAVVSFTEPLTRAVSELVVTAPGEPPLDRVEDLAGREVYVRASSSYAESLGALNATLRSQGLAPAKVVPVDERLETEDILEMVNAGVYPATVADSSLVDLWSQVLTAMKPHPSVVVESGRRYGWAFRHNSPQLEKLLNDFVRSNRQGTLTGNVIINRYFEDADWLQNPGRQRDAERFRSMVELFRRYGEQYDLDYLLLMAQAYQESQLDQSRRSRSGAIGVMQMLPSTARDPNVGIPDITSLENNVHAGVKYLRFILDRYFADAEMDDINKHLFAFAAYNAGPARVAGLRAKAEAMGLDPNRWRGNVEVVAAREIGRETVQYVANIFKYYVAYRLVEDRRLERGQVKSSL
jgi:membrane-bound lytic murein transglycosylase MltF